MKRNPGADVFPLSLYIDGVPVTRRDGLLILTVTNLATSRSWLLAAVKKSAMCKCGCRGWCSLWSIMNWVHWCLESLATGLLPSKRSDGTDFWPQEEQRQKQAGQSGPLGCLLQLRGDWAEFAHTLGFPSWSTKLAPCPFCQCVRDNMFSLLPQCSASNSPWHDKTFQSLTDHCVRAEHQVDGSKEDWGIHLASLTIR